MQSPWGEREEEREGVGFSWVGQSGEGLRNSCLFIIFFLWGRGEGAKGLGTRVGEK